MSGLKIGFLNWKRGICRQNKERKKGEKWREFKSDFIVEFDRPVFHVS